MRYCLCILSALFLIGVSQNVSAQKKDYDAFELSPQPVRVGQVVKLAVDAGKNELQLKGDPVYAIMICYTSGTAKAFDAIMSAGKKNLTASFLIPEGTDAIAFKFLQGNKQVTNNGNGYFFPVLNEKGEEQTATYYSIYRLHSNEFYSGITKGNAVIANRNYGKWFEKQNLDKMSFYEKAVALYIKKDTTLFCDHMNGITSAADISEGHLNNLFFYGRMCGKKLIPILEAEQKRRFPRGNWYYRPWNDTLRTLTSIAEKLTWLKAYKLANPEEAALSTSMMHNMYSQVMAATAKTFDIKNLLLIAGIQEKLPDYFDRTLGNFNLFFNQALDKDTLTAELLPVARNVFLQAKAKLIDTAGKDPGESQQIYYNRRYRDYLNIASIYGTFLFKKSEYDSAAHYTKMAAAYYEWKNSIFNDRYFSAIEKNAVKKDMAEMVVEQMKTAFRQEASTANMKNIFLRVYAFTGKTDGKAVLETILAEKRQILMAEMKMKMKSEPAPDFVLPGLNGGEISLASLKGKVVLLDFWATWCGPCIASFPSMQKLVDANRDNKEVKILFVDTWQKEVDKFDVVKKFMESNPYRFDVYMDHTDKAVKDFNIEGIPTKIVIDKKGIIRFFSVGFHADNQRGVDELQAMIDLAAMQ